MRTLQDRQQASKRARRRLRSLSGLPTLRKRLEAAVEAALAVLDALDGDPDLEPALGSVGGSQDCMDQRHWAGPALRALDALDTEDQCEGEGDHDEREPETEDWAYLDTIDQTVLTVAETGYRWAR